MIWKEWNAAESPDILEAHHLRIRWVINQTAT